LDVGCGIGRLLGTLDAGSVGVDHNAESVAVARANGLEAYTTEEFRARDWEPFDGMLMSGLIEHLTPEDGLNLVREYVPHLRSGGRLLFICPQERGYKYDPTHIRWTTPDDLNELSRAAGLIPVSSKSFPFPRPVGKVFTFNEFNVLAVKP
jgi:SAM-dependent methyltransferase